MVEDLRTAHIPEERIPELIQGGMGVGVSDWRLARSVAIAGEKLDKDVLGVISGTGLAILLTNRLQKRDPNTIRALSAFDPEITKEIFDAYLPAEERLPGQRYKLPPKPEVLVTGKQETKDKMNRLLVAAAFVEVWLAKEGHNRPIGMNLLEKVQLVHLPTILGAMMAGVDTLIVGAGIPRQIPQILENFANNKEASYIVDVKGSKEKIELKLDPKQYVAEGTQLKKPNFYAIVSHHALAQFLASSKTQGEVDGFVIEGPTAGGHNAPARNKNVFDERGQPVYGERDKPDLEEIRNLGKPYWMAGSYTERLTEAQEAGAAGIQIGTPFALSNESGLIKEKKDRMRAQIMDDALGVVTSARVSPTGYPFQVVQIPGTLSEEEIYDARKRVCGYGYLVEIQLDEDGNPIFSCPAEPVKAYVRKGGKIEETEGRVCLCTGLAGAVGQGQTGEPAIFTLGKDVEPVRKLMGISPHPDGSYSAEDVVGFVFSDTNTQFA